MCRVVACTRELSTVDGAHRTTFAKPRIRSPLRRALSLLTYCAALAVGANDPGHAADAPVYMPVKAPQFAPPPYPEPSWNWGAMLGAVGTASASVNSTAPGGFYKGAFDDVMAPYAGLFADFRIARFGSSSQPFGTWVLSIGPVVDVRHSSLSYNGTGGGVPVSDSGRLTQWDYLGVLKLTTPLTPASNLSIFAGGGGATLRPTGTPTGPGGPALTGSNTTPVFRAGAEISQQIAGGLSVALQLAYQRTTSVSFGTTRPDERFRFGDNDSFMLGLTLNFNDLFQAPPPPPRRPRFIGQETTPGGGGGSTKVATDSGLQPTTEEAKKGRTSLGSCIKGGNCGSFIWRPQAGGLVADTDRIKIFHQFYKKPLKARLCDVVFYNDKEDKGNDHVEFVSKVDANGNVVETIGQEGDTKPISLGPPKKDELGSGTPMTINDPPGSPSDKEIQDARDKVKNPKNLSDWDEFLRLCRARNKIDLSKLK